MRNRFLLVLALVVLAASALPVTGRGTIESVDTSDVPNEWCGPPCEVLPHGHHEARFILHVDPLAQTGEVRFTDHGVRYEDRKISIVASIDFVYVFDETPDWYRYNVSGTYEPTGGSAVPAGVFNGSFEWTFANGGSGFARIYLVSGDDPGFSYMNRGTMESGMLTPPPGS